MEENIGELKEEMDEKLMEAKVFLSETRYTNINIDPVKDLIRKAVNNKKKEEYKESIKYSEEAIKLAETILNIFEKLKSGKKSIKEMKEREIGYQDSLEELKRSKKLADDGKFEESKNLLSKLMADFEEKLKAAEGEEEINKKIPEVLSKIPDDGITLYSLNKELGSIDENELENILNHLESEGYIKMEKKRRWQTINLTGKEYEGEEKKETPEEEKDKKETMGIEVEETEPIKALEEIVETPHIILNLTKDEYKFLEDFWDNIILENMEEKTIEALGWDEKEKFYKDVFISGLDIVEDNPIEFIKSKILSEFPVVKNDVDEEIVGEEIQEKIGDFQVE